MKTLAWMLVLVAIAASQPAVWIDSVVQTVMAFVK